MKIFSVVFFLFLIPFSVRANEARTPVLIIPGVLGTEIKNTDGELIWADTLKMVNPFNSDDFMDPLLLDDYLHTKENLIIGEILKKKSFGTINFDYSQGLIEQFEQQGYTEGVDLFTFPYDWRYGVTGLGADGKAVNVEALKGQIEYILKQTESGQSAGKVDVVAHSTGGLIVKQYVYDYQSTHGIGKVVMVGVPHEGSPKAFKVFVVGDNFGIPGLSAKQMKKLALNMPVVYDLTASENSFGGRFMHIHNPLAEDPDLVDVRPTYDEAVMQLHNLGLLNFNALFASQEMHKRLDTTSFTGFKFRKLVDAYSIFGCASPTFGSFTMTIHKHAEPDFDFPKLVSGDGTVPQESGGALTVDVGKLFWAPKASHGKMMSADGIRQHIVNIITGSSLDVSGKVLNSQEFNADHRVCDLKKGRWWQIFSPVNIEAIDSEGNRTGVIGADSIQNDIPGADLQIFGDHKYLYVPTESGQAYTVNLSGTGSGSFTFKDLIMENGLSVGEQVYADIPVTEKFSGQVRIEEGEALLDLDFDGDGEVDQSLTPDSPTPNPPAPEVIKEETDEPEESPELPDAGGPSGTTSSGSSYVYTYVETRPGKVLAAVRIADGTLVLDSSDNRTVYMIGNNGKKYGFTSENVFKSFGFDFGNLISHDLSSVELGGTIDSSDQAHPDGSLVRETNTIWFLKEGQRHGIPSMTVFRERGFDFKNVVPMNVHDRFLPEVI